jgi:CBS domain containing-hemolysin-like protein
LDTTSFIATTVLVIAAVLLVVISGAEAGITALSRSRVRVAQTNGLSGLLTGYIQQRHQLLRFLSVGVTTTIVSGSFAVAFLVLRGREATGLDIALIAVAVILAVTLLRQSARTIALISPESAGARLARPIRILQVIFSPLAWLAAAPVSALLRAFGWAATPAEPDPVEELMVVLEATGNPEAQEFLVEERRMMRGVMSMSGQSVREIMSPRMDLVAVSTDASLGDVMKIVIDSGFTRIPLYGESIDHVIGVIYAKDLLTYVQAGDIQPGLTDIARPPYFVPEAKRANELLAEMQRDQVHMAIAVDEYGGTAGVITVEDLIEEIVGEIVDEYDTDEVEVMQLSDDVALVDARLSLDDLNELFGTDVDSEDFDTVGGLVFSLLGRLASPRDEVESPEHRLQLRVMSVLGRRIKQVRIERIPPSEESGETDAAS